MTKFLNTTLLFSFFCASAMEIKHQEKTKAVATISNDYKKMALIIGTLTEKIESKTSPITKCMDKVKKLKTRNQILQELNEPLLSSKYGNKYISKQVHKTVAHCLGTVSNDDLVNIMYAASFLDIKLMVKSCAYIWVENQFNKDTKITLHKILKIAHKSGIAPNITSNYVRKYWSNKNYDPCNDLDSDESFSNIFKKWRIDAGLVNFYKVAHNNSLHPIHYFVPISFIDEPERYPTEYSRSSHERPYSSISDNFLTFHTIPEKYLSSKNY